MCPIRKHFLCIFIHHSSTCLICIVGFSLFPIFGQQQRAEVKYWWKEKNKRAWHIFPSLVTQKRDEKRERTTSISDNRFRYAHVLQYCIAVWRFCVTLTPLIDLFAFSHFPLLLVLHQRSCCRSIKWPYLPILRNDRTKNFEGIDFGRSVITRRY